MSSKFKRILTWVPTDENVSWFDEIMKRIRISRLLSGCLEGAISLFFLLPIPLVVLGLHDDIFEFLDISTFAGIIIYIALLVFFFGFVSVIIEIKNQLIDLNETIKKITAKEPN